MTKQDTLQRDITAAKTLYNSAEYFITEQTVFRHVHGDKENGEHVVVYNAHWPEHAGMSYTSDKWVSAAFPAKTVSSLMRKYRHRQNCGMYQSNTQNSC